MSIEPTESEAPYIYEESIEKQNSYIDISDSDENRHSSNLTSDRIYENSMEGTRNSPYGECSKDSEKSMLPSNTKNKNNSNSNNENNRIKNSGAQSSLQRSICELYGKSKEEDANPNNRSSRRRRRISVSSINYSNKINQESYDQTDPIFNSPQKRKQNSQQSSVANELKIDPKRIKILAHLEGIKLYTEQVLQFSKINPDLGFVFNPDGSSVLNVRTTKDFRLVYQDISFAFAQSL